MPPPHTHLVAYDAASKAITIHAISPDELPKLIEKLPPHQTAWVKANTFTAAPGETLCLPDNTGTLASVWFGRDPQAGPFHIAQLANKLPTGLYKFSDTVSQPQLAALGWLLEAYQFTRYQTGKPRGAILECPADIDQADLLNTAQAMYLVRDLINTPALDMGPDELEAAVREVAKPHQASITITSGKDLEKNFPMIHAVGMASTRPPRLIDMQWGTGPKITLVGKGVCFDTGGLDIKGASGMILMKKDMGGAAHVLGLASMIMAAKLPVRLRVLIPAVENSIAGNAFRPGDVLTSRNGLTVEIGNTDAEGRLVLADALDLADAESPDMLIDMATLTGAARVALGPDLPPYFCRDDDFCKTLEHTAAAVYDPLWRMPFWAPYHHLIASKIADINNAGTGGFAGAITAALFLQKFVSQAKCYAHFDVYGWAPTASPARPHGGEAYAIRALFEMIRQRYQKAS